MTIMQDDKESEKSSGVSKGKASADVLSAASSSADSCLLLTVRESFGDTASSDSSR